MPPQAVFPIVSGRCRSQNLLLRGDNPCREADLGITVLTSHTEQNIYPVFHSDQFQPTLYTAVGELVNEEARQPLLER